MILTAMGGKADSAAMTKSTTPSWRKPDGDPVACTEKLKVLEQNLAEFQIMALDFLEDAALMGCDVEHVRQVMAQTLDAIPAPFDDKN